VSGKYLKARQLAKEMEEKAKKTAEKKKEAKKKEEEAKEALEILNSLDVDLDMDNLKERLEEGEKELENKNFEKSYDIFEEVLEEMNTRSLEKHDEILDPIEELLEEADEVIEIESLQEKISKSRNLIKEKDFEEAFNKALEIEDEFEKVIEKKLNEELEKLKSILEIMGEDDSGKEKLEEFISKVEYSLEAGDYKRTFSLIGKTKERFGDEVEKSLNEAIELLKERKNQLEEKDIKFQNLKEWLEKAKSKTDQGKHLEALEFIEKSKGEINPIYGEEILRDKFNKLKHEIKEAEDIGAETKSVNEGKKRVEKLLEENEIEKAKNLLEGTFEEVEKKKFDKVLNTIAESREDFIKAKEMGANIEKPMELLKKARNSLKNDDYQKALDWANKGREEVQHLRKRIEEAKKDIDEKQERINGLKDVLDEDLTDLEELVNEAEDKLEEKSTEDAISLLEKVEDKIESDIHDDISSLNDEFDRLNQAAEDIGIDIDELSTKRERSEKKIESSEYVEGGRILKEGISTVKQKIEDRFDENIEGIRKEMDEFRGMEEESKRDINELIEKSKEEVKEDAHISAVQNLKEARNRFEKAKTKTINDIIERNSNFLTEIEDLDEIGIDLDSYREMIEESKNSLNQGDFSEALEILDEFLTEFSDEVYTESREEVQRTEEKGAGVDDLEKKLERSSEEMEKEDHVGSIQTSIDVMKEAREKREMRNDAYKKIYDVNSKVSKFEEKGKLDDERIKDRLEKAKKEFKQENYSKAIRDAVEAQELFEKLEMKEKFSKKKKDLEDKFLKAKNMDVVDERINKFDFKPRKIDEIKEKDGISDAQDELEKKHDELKALLEDILKDKKEEIEDFLDTAGTMGFDTKAHKEKLDKIKSLIEEEKPLDGLIFLEEIDEEIKNIGRKKDLAKQKIDDMDVLSRKIKVMGASTSGSEKLLDEAKKRLDEDRYEEALEKAESAENKLRKAHEKRVESILENFNKKIEKLKEKGKNIDPAEEKIQKAKNAKKEGNYLESIKFSMESESELEKMNNQKIIAGNIISRTNKMLDQLQEKGVFVDEAKETLRECEQDCEKGLYPKAVDTALKTIEKVSKILQNYTDIESFLDSLSPIIDDLKEDSKVFPKLLEKKKEVEENYKDGEYHQAKEHIEDIENILLENENYLKNTILSIQKKLEKAGLRNIEKSKEKLERGKVLMDLNDPIKTLKNIQEAKELSGLKKQKRFEELKGRVYQSIENAKKFGASVEKIEKEVQEAKKKKDSGDIELAYEKIKQANNMVEEALEVYSPKLKVKAEDILTVNEWNTTEVHIINEGEALGKNLQLEVRGGKLRNFNSREKLKAGEKREINIEIKPEREDSKITAKVFRIFDDEIFEDEEDLKVTKGPRIEKIEEETTCDYCGDEIKKGEKAILCGCGNTYETSCGEEIDECVNCGAKLKTEEKEKRKRRRVSLDI